jgi:hypothetical protein
MIFLRELMKLRWWAVGNDVQSDVEDTCHKTLCFQPASESLAYEFFKNFRVPNLQKLVRFGLSKLFVNFDYDRHGKIVCVLVVAD